MKLQLSKVDQLYHELFGIIQGNVRLTQGLLYQKISFPLKFKVQSKIGKQCQELVEMIEQEKRTLAISFGAVQEGKSWKFATIDRIENTVKITDWVEPDKVKEFNSTYLSWLENEDNAVEVSEVKINLSEFVDENGKKLFFQENYTVFMDNFVTDDLS